jgi:hypothetical protein
VAGIVIAVSAALTIVALARHPTIAHREPAAAIADIVQFAAIDRIVHAVVIGIMGALLFALCVFSVRRNLRDQTVLGALIAYAIGVAAMIGAAILDGFVIPSVASGYAGASPNALAGAVAVLRLCGAAVQAAGALGVTAISIAIALWSVGLVRGAGALRLTGIVGLSAAALPAPVFAFGGAMLTPHLLGAIAVGQAVWYLGVAALLIRDHV